MNQQLKSNRTLNGAFPIVAAALGAKLGVQVQVGGHTAKTDGQVIHLPAYDRDDPDYKDIAWGYLAHEAGHVRFTDFEAFRRAATTPIRKALVNILEDIRIESALHELYPGTRLTLGKTIDHMVRRDIYANPADGDSHPAQVLSRFLIFRLRTEVAKQTVLAGYADQAERQLEAVFPVGAVARLFGLLSVVPGLASTQEAVRLADDILRMIKEEQDKAEQAASQQDACPDSDDGATAQSDTDGDDGATAQSGTDGDGTQAADDDGADPSPSSSSQASPGDGDSSNPAQGPGRTPPGSPPAADNPAPTDPAQAARTLASVLSAGAGDVPEDLGDAARNVLGGQEAASYGGYCLPEPESTPRNEAAGQRLLAAVLSESVRARTALQGLVQSETRERVAHKSTGSRLDTRRLHRLAHGDTRVFTRRFRRQAPDTALHILVDGSGSMGAATDGKRRIDVAMEAVMALAMALEGIQGVNPAVTRFPGVHGRDAGLVMPHGGRVRLHAPAFDPVADHGTPLASALWYAASEVLRTREERKVILVVGDGQPDDINRRLVHTRDIVGRCEATGIELVGIGVGLDMGHIFRRAVRINSLGELTPALFAIGRELLLPSADTAY